MKKAAVFFLSALTIFGAYAQDKVDQADAPKTTQKAKKSMDPRSRVRRAMNNYRKENKLPVYGQLDDKGRFYITGSALVDSNPQKANFIDARSIAYQKAYIDALANAVTYRSGHNIANVIREFSRDSSSIPADMMDPDKQATVLEQKVEALLEAELDQKLRELNVDPQQFKAKTVKEKRQLLCDSYIQESVKEAFGSSIGCLPIQTFEESDEKGNYAIGVVLRFDVSTIEIAECVAQYKRPRLNRKDLAQSLEKALPTEKEMLTQFGVRVFFDESGTPTLLSFGQKGSTYTGTDAYEKDTEMEAAMKLAESDANAQLTYFINSALSFRDVSRTGQARIKNEYTKMDKSKEQRTIQAMIKQIATTTEIKGNASLKGRSVVYKEVLIHDTDHEIAVAVVQFSFKTADGVDAIVNRTDLQEELKDEQKSKPASNRGKAYDF